MSFVFATAGCQSQRAPVALPQSSADITAIIELAKASPGARAAELYLDAARQLSATGDLDAAAAIINDLTTTGKADLLAARERFELVVLDAQIEFELGSIERASNRALLAAPTNAEQDTRLTILNARIQAAQRHYAGAAATLMLLNPQDPFAPKEAKRMVAAIWAYARQVPSYRVAELAELAVEPTVRAWWQVIAAVNEALTAADQNAAWAQWRKQHPIHIAAQYPPPVVGVPGSTPARIAVLLPLTGRLAGAGEAVRDGFLSAYFSSGPDPSQSIRLYDTATGPIGGAYEQALANGADVIVGPLAKDNVADIRALDPVVPVLALNTVAAPEVSDASHDRARAPQMIQFALAVEDEAQAIARRVAEDGLNRVVLFHGDQGWSVRAANALAEALAGALSASSDVQTKLVGVGVFQDNKEITAIVGDVLLIEASSQRHLDLARLFGDEVEFTARRREDVDAVIALIDGVQLATLRPALRFHFASDLPIYTSSQAARDTDDLAELNRIRVCDTPWRLYSSTLKTELHRAYPNSRGAFDSLFAFGIDAFRIVNQLPRLIESPENRVMGSTGILTLDDAGVIRRELAWAIVRRGRFEPLPSVAQAPAAARR